MPKRPLCGRGRHPPVLANAGSSQMSLESLSFQDLNPTGNLDQLGTGGVA